MPNLPPGFRVVTTPDEEQNRGLPSGFRVVGPPSPPPFSQLRQAGGLQQTPGDEDLWMTPEQAAPSVPPDDWRRGVIAPIERNEATGDLRFAMPQMALDAWGAVTLPGDVLMGNVDPMSEEGMARAFDLSGIMLPGAPVGPRGMVRPSGEIPPAKFQQAVRREGMDEQTINAALADLGPGGMVADLGPSLQGLAAGIARTPGDAQTDLVNALRTRAFEARDRIQPQVDEILGPSVSRGQFETNIRDLRSAVSPIYQGAFEGASPVSTSTIATQLDDFIGQNVGTAKTRLSSIRSMFDTDDGLTSDPRILFSIRNEIDDMLDAPDVGRVAGQLRDIRRAVDDELAANVPGIKDADARWQEIVRQQEGFEQGRTIFQQGQNAVDPRDLGPQLEAGVVPAGQFIGPSGETFALSQGARNELDRLIGTGSQNRTNLATAIRGDGSWNRQKLAQLFGEEKADAIIRLFDNEARMAETERQAIGSSITASAQASQQALQPRSVGTPIMEGPLGVNVGNAIRRGGEAVFGPFAENATNARNQAIAEALMEGPGWYQNRTSPETLAVLRALIAGGAPPEGEGAATRAIEIARGLGLLSDQQTQ